VVFETKGADESTLLQSAFMLQQCESFAYLPTLETEDALIAQAMVLLKQRTRIRRSRLR